MPRRSTIALLILISAGGMMRAAPQAVEIIKNGFGQVGFLRFSPGGRELARVCAFGRPMLFDTTGYAKARTFPIELRMVAYSLDGKLIATAEGTDGARVWDASAPGRPMFPGAPSVVEAPLHVLQAPSTDRSVRIFRAEFSPDGTRLITTHANGHVKVWNTASWTTESDLALSTAEVRAAAFAPDSKTFFVGDTDGVLRQWNIEQKAEVHAERTALGAILDIEISPDGRTVVTIHDGKHAAIWESHGWTHDVREGVESAAFSADGRRLAFGGRRVELVDAKGPATGPPMRTIELPEMSMREVMGPGAAAALANQPNADRKIPMGVTALAFSPDGRTLAAGCQDGTVRLVAVGAPTGGAAAASR